MVSNTGRQCFEYRCRVQRKPISTWLQSPVSFRFWAICTNPRFGKTLEISPRLFWTSIIPVSFQCFPVFILDHCKFCRVFQSRRMRWHFSSPKVTIQGFWGHSPQVRISRLRTKCDKLHQHELKGQWPLCSEETNISALSNISVFMNSAPCLHWTLRRHRCREKHVLDGTWKYACWKCGCFPASTLLLCL